MSTTIVSDNFVLDAGKSAPLPLHQHAPEIGGAWVKINNGQTGALSLDNSGILYGQGVSQNAGYYNDVPTPTGAYTVAIAITPNNFTDQGGPGVNITADNSSQLFARFDSGTLQLIDIYNGALVTNIRSGAWSPQNGDVITLDVNPTTGKIKARVNDGSSVSTPEANYTPVAAGKVGIINYHSGDANVSFYDNFRVVAAATAFSIAPTPAGLSFGQTQQFTASAAATWTATGGTVSSTGLYTAPNVAGTYAVTATATSGGATAMATVTVTAPVAPGTPVVSIKSGTGGDVVSVTTPGAPGTNAVAGYRLYAGATPGGEGGASVANLSGAGIGAFAAQASPAAGASRYYVVKAIDSAGNLGAASNEVVSRPAPTSGTPCTVSANYGPGAAGQAISVTVSLDDGGVLVSSTTVGVAEAGSVPGRYAYTFNRPPNRGLLVQFSAPSGGVPADVDVSPDARLPVVVSL